MLPIEGTTIMRPGVGAPWHPVTGILRAVPTAAEYDLWAWRLGGLADELTGLTGPLVGLASPKAIAGGLVAVTVDVGVRAAQANSLAAAGMLRELSEECSRRAVVCAEYATAMEQYEAARASYQSAMASYLERVESAEAGEGSAPRSCPWPPSEPVRPADWVER